MKTLLDTLKETQELEYLSSASKVTGFDFEFKKQFPHIPLFSGDYFDVKQAVEKMQKDTES